MRLKFAYAGQTSAANATGIKAAPNIWLPEDEDIASIRDLPSKTKEKNAPDRTKAVPKACRLLRARLEAKKETMAMDAAVPSSSQGSLQLLS